MVGGPAQQLAGPAEELWWFGGGRSPVHGASGTIELAEKAWRLGGGQCPVRAPWASGHQPAENHTLAQIFLQQAISHNYSVQVFVFSVFFMVFSLYSVQNTNCTILFFSIQHYCIFLYVHKHKLTCTILHHEMTLEGTSDLIPTEVLSDLFLDIHSLDIFLQLRNMYTVIFSSRVIE